MIGSVRLFLWGTFLVTWTKSRLVVHLVFSFDYQCIHRVRSIFNSADQYR